MSHSEDNDAAADFLAREQEELGDLQEDLGFNVVPPDDNGEFDDMTERPPNGFGFGMEDGNPHISTLTPPLDGGLRSASPDMRSASPDMRSASPDMRSASPGMRSFSPVKPEPETLRLWRIGFEERLQKKDECEAGKKADMEKEAQKELDEWYKRIDEQQNIRKQSNREQQQVYENERDDTQAGGEWERVCRLCEFNPKAAPVKTMKDTSRMRGILLQLKTQPLVR